MISSRHSLLLLMLIAAAASAFLYQYLKIPTLIGVTKTNGRMEVQRVDVATLHSGRLTKVNVHEGDMVGAGTAIALLDTVELNAQIAEAKALERQSTEAINRAKASLEHCKAEFNLAKAQQHRARELARNGYISTAELDQSIAQYKVANAAMSRADIAITEAEAAKDAASARVTTLNATLENMVLQAPVSGRVEYRLAEPGAVLSAGARVVTLLDLTEVSMTIFLPATVVGKLALGSEARVKMDAAPEYTLPAYIAYIASDAQFTPKSVETVDERELFMYRVKLKFDAALLTDYQPLIKAGMTGDAYMLTDIGTTWPHSLSIKLPAAR